MESTTTTERTDEAPPTPATTSTYRLRKRLREMELKLMYPRLSRKWREKIPRATDPRNLPNDQGQAPRVPRGRPKR